MRHILSHEYDRLAPDKLWRVLRVHLEPLISALETNLKSFSDGDRPTPP
jgi:uncharacterized protein with HEPN domain